MAMLARSSLLIAASLLLSCLSARYEANRNDLPLVLHAAYSSGGDGPTLQTLAVFGNGLIRLKWAGGRARWKRLRAGELERLERLVHSEAFVAEYSDLPRRFFCCDAEEIALELIKSTGTVDATKNPPTILLPFSQRSGAVYDLVALLNGIAQAHFGEMFPESRESRFES